MTETSGSPPEASAEQGTHITPPERRARAAISLIAATNQTPRAPNSEQTTVKVVQRQADRCARANWFEPWAPGRWPNWLRALLVALICAAGFVIYGRVVIKKYPLEAWLFWDFGKIWLNMLVFNASSLAFGYFLLKRALRIRKLPLAETLLFSMTLGVVALCWGMYLGGALGWFQPWFALALPAVFLAVGFRSLPELYRRYGYSLRHRRATGSGGARVLHALAVAFGILGAALLYLGVANPGEVNYDAAWYHLPIAQDYAREGRLVPFLTDYNRAFPQLTSMLHTWGFLMPGLTPQLRWMHALHLEYIFVLWKIFAIVPFAQWMLNGRRTPALWAVFFLFTDVFVYDKSIGGSADHVLGFFAIPGVLAALRALPRFEARYAALTAIIVGGALLTKVQGIYLVVAVAGLLGAKGVVVGTRHALTRVRKTRRVETITLKQVGLAALIIAGGALVVFSPHLIKNTAFYGNPIYPFGQELFPSTPSHEKSQFFFEHAYANRPYLPKGDTRVEKMWNAVKLFFTFSFEPHYSFTHYYPTMGSLFTLLLPGLLFLRRSQRLWLGAVAAFLMIFTWGNTYIGDRYLQAAITVPIGVTAALLVRLWQLSWIARLGLLPLVALQLVWGADAPFITGHGAFKTSIDLFRSGYENKRSIEQRYPQRSWQLRLTEALPEDAVILSRTFRTTLGIDRTVLSDVQAWQGVFLYETLSGPRAMYDLYKKNGVTHLMYERGHRPHETLQGAVLFEELIHHYSAKPQTFGPVGIVELPEKPPPPDEGEYLVFVGNIPGYQNGWYPVTELTLYDRLPPELREAPKPKALLRGNPPFEALMKETRAVALATRRYAPTRIKQALSDYREVERFSDFSIFLRSQKR